jgi:WS/DGAT/MGAT family acyltransferase
MERLTTQDATFLYVENELNHMSIATIALFDGPAPAGDEIEDWVASKLDLVPRYRQRVHFVPFDAGRPVWCDDRHFDLRYHVRHTALPSPGDEAQLRTLVGRVMSQQLDRTKPLWELWVVEGLAGGRWSMIIKLHHCLADGVSATDLTTLLLDDRPDAERREPNPWSPEHTPSSLQLLTDALVDRATSPREVIDAVREAVRAPGRAARKLAEVADGLATFGRFAHLDVEWSLNGPVGPHRRWRWVRAPLADVKQVRGRHGGTLNDVVLASITRAFRDLLLERGEPVDGLVVRTLVPVSVRREGEHDHPDNRVSAMFAELPVGLADPLERLRSIREQMDQLKSHHQADAGETLMALSGLAPPVLFARAARVLAEMPQPYVQTVTTNVPGPQHPLYAAGRRMRHAFLYVPLASSVRLGIAIFSYDGELTFGVTGDAEHTPDIDVLCRGIERGIDELLAEGSDERALREVDAS